MKQQFEVSDGKLIDRHEHDRERGCDVRWMPDLASPSAGIPVPKRPDRGVAEMLDELEQGDSTVALRLTRYVEDRRVLPAMRKQLDNRQGLDCLNLAQALGAARDPDAVERLEELLDEFDSERRDTRVVSDGWDSRGLAAVGISKALLLIDPWHMGAAEVLIELREHSDANTRRHLALAAVKLLSESGRTAPMRNLERQLEVLIGDEDDQVFVNIAPAYVMKRWSSIRERASTLARDGDYMVRLAAQSLLANVPSPWGAEALAVLLDWLPQETSARHRVALTGNLVGLIEESRLKTIVADLLEHESPAVRFDTIHQILGRCSEELMSELASGALDDEPDPVLRRWLSFHARP